MSKGSGGRFGHCHQAKPLFTSSSSLALAPGNLFLRLQRYSEAELVYRELLLRNSENYSYHEKLEQSLRLGTQEDRMAHYKELAVEFPRSHVIRKMPLLISSGECDVLLCPAVFTFV